MNTKLFSSVTAILALTTMACNKMNKPDAPGYSGGDITNEVGVLRDKQTKAATLQVNDDMDWEVYAGPSVEKIDLSRPLISGQIAGTYKLNVAPASRSYFQVVTAKGNAILSERHLPMQGGHNYRDMGGFKTRDGHYVKWGKVFRSDDMHKLTKADLDYLASIPLISVVDFRSTQEIEAAPDELPSTVTGHYLYSITPGNFSEFGTWTKSPTIFDMPDMMKEMNGMLVSDIDAIDQYRRFFALLQDDGKVPLMFHCSAGKDRTGMAAALFLSALGVDEKTIMDDYLASNEYLGDKYAALVKQDPQFKAITQVRAEYLQAGLDRIRKDHGSVEGFLTGTLGVDLEKMKATYLY